MDELDSESLPILARHDADSLFDRSGKHPRDDRKYSEQLGNVKLSLAQSNDELTLSFGYGRMECYPKAAPGRLIVRKMGTVGS